MHLLLQGTLCRQHEYFRGKNMRNDVLESWHYIWKIWNCIPRYYFLLKLVFFFTFISIFWKCLFKRQTCQEMMWQSPRSQFWKWIAIGQTYINLVGFDIYDIDQNLFIFCCCYKSFQTKLLVKNEVWNSDFDEMVPT